MNLIEHHESQRDERHVARQELGKGPDRGLRDALKRILAGMGGFGRRGLFGLRGNERRDDADQGKPGHDDVAGAPRSMMTETETLEPAHHKQCARGRGEHADTIGGDIGRHAGGLLVLAEAFHPEGVDDDVLRRRCGGDQQRAEGDNQRRAGRIGDGKENDRRDQQ